MTDDIKDVVSAVSPMRTADNPKITFKDILKHFMDESEKDPLYLTKIILHAVGTNIFSMILRIAIYVLLLYPFLTNILHVTQGIASLIVFLGIILYYSAKTVYDKIMKKVKDNIKSAEVKSTVK